MAITKYLHFYNYRNWLYAKTMQYVLLNRCGGNFRVLGKALPVIRHPHLISLGRNVRINEYAYLCPRRQAKITIEDDVTISAYAKVLTAGYDVALWMREDKEQLDIHVEKDIYIGKNCWIAAGVIVLPGVRITGSNVVIGAGAVVVHDVDDDNVVVCGNPARVVKRYR
jgi:acetyltransferase-like isoleucine patch superfamily enzyme